MEAVFYVEIDGVIWKVFQNGAWVQVQPFESVSIDIPMFLATTQPDGSQSGSEQLVDEQEPDAEVNDQELSQAITELVDQHSNTANYNSSLNSLSTPDYVSNSGLILTGYIRPSLDETLAQAGFQTLDTSQSNGEKSFSNNDDAFILSPSASITVSIDDGGDGYENRFEIPSVTLFGTTQDVRDGVAVAITVTDINGNSVQLQATVTDNQYVVNNADLSALDEGQLTVVATIVDVTGNSIAAHDDTIKDTLANIQGGLDGFGDATINQVEQLDDVLFGTVNNVEDGQAITIVVQDIHGDVLQFETTVQGNLWLIRDVDLSSLSDGLLIVSTQAVDIAGNPAVDVSTIVKDTTAQITIHFDDGDGQVDLFEAPAVRLFGDVVDVEEGQRVSVAVTDSAGTTYQYETRVVDQSWEIVDADLSNLVDGPLSASASTIDVAGNQAQADDSSILIKDSAITVEILDGGDGFENQFEVPIVSIIGTTDKVPDGAEILIELTDINGQMVTATAIVDSNSYRVDGVNIVELDEGSITVRAVVVDAFNVIEAFDDSVKDTLAEINGEIDGLGDAFINFDEQGSATITGQVSNVEDGQQITVTLVDASLQKLTFVTTVDGSSWQISNVDLTSFVEGDITTIAETQDIAGNPARSSTTIVKDTQAIITIEIDDGGDNILNVEERLSVRLFGTVNNIEDGQSVSITILDSSGQSLQFETVVIDQKWELDNVNLSEFVDGVVTASASALDVAGNSAFDETETTSLDSTLPTIDIDTLDGLDVLYFRDGTLDSLQGTTTGVAQDLPVTVTVSDGTTEVELVSTVDGIGQWVVTDIDVSGLDQSATWEITATTANAIGNIALDDMPTIELPDRVVLSETYVGIFNEDSASSDINIQNAEFTFNETQDAFLELVSTGLALSFTLSADKKTIVFSRTGGETVMEAQIINGQVEMTLYQGLEDSRPGDLQTELLVKGTQKDLDGTIEEVIAPVIITVQDSRPLAIDDRYTVTEAQISTGNLLSNDADLDGGLQVRNVSVGGVSKSVSEGAPAIFDLPEGKLFVYASGQWVLEAARDLNHTQSQSIELTYRAGDASIDFDYADATINIIDGEQGVIGSGQSTVLEDNLTRDDVVGAGSVLIKSGSDNPDSDSITFDADTLATLDALNLTSGSNFIALTYEISDDGKSITAYSLSTAIFTLSLSTQAVGNDLLVDTNITLHHPLNQDASTDIIYLPLKLTGSDSDGTPLISGEFTWQIKDGTNPKLTENTTISLSEDELTAQALEKTGSFDLSVGSDPIANAYFELADLPALASEGVPVFYTLSPNGNVVTAYQGDVRGDIVFVLAFDRPDGQLDETLTYTLLIDKALDEVNGTDILKFPITVVDSDQDKSVLDLTVTISDATGGEITVTDMSVSERPVDTVLAGDITDIDSATVTVEASKDPIIMLRLSVSDGDIVYDANSNPLTQNGQFIYWKDNGDGTYEGELADGTSIFVVTLPDQFQIAPGASADATIQFQLREQVDHDQVGQGESINLNLPLVAIDTDGTELSADSTVTLYDGQYPSVQVLGSISVSEDGLLGDSEDTGVEENNPSIAFVGGSDDFSEFIVDFDAFNALGIESADQQVTLLDKNSNGWYVAQNEVGQEVFRIRIQDSGNVDFELSKPLDHALGQDTNNLPVEFEVAAKDYDGDVSVFETLVVNVTDDVPEPRISEVELVEGDDLSENLLTPQFAGADGATITSVSYQGTNYSSADFTDGKLTIVLIDPLTSDEYGTLIVSQDGTFNLKTKDFVDNTISVRDEVDYVVTDADGDSVTSTAKLILDDAKGLIRAPDVEMREDETQSLSISVVLGDLDQGEKVENITISEASAFNGTFYLDGVALPVVGDTIVLTGDQLLTIGSEFVIPNGSLTYQPAKHQSNTTQSIVLNIGSKVENQDGSFKDLTTSLEVSVLPVADTPLWDDDSQFTYNAIEDPSSDLELNLGAVLVDADGSEALTFQFTNIPDGITLYLSGNIVKESNSYTQQQLDKMTIVADENVAGVFEFEVTATATEQGNTFDSSADESASTTRVVTVNISPNADKPELSVRNIDGLEDTFIPLNEAIKGILTDTDGSESLYYEIVVQQGWGLSGAGFTELAPNTYLVQASDIENGDVKLISKADISSVTEQLSIDVTAVAIESEVDGLPPINSENRSETKTIVIDLKGVIDEPVVIDGGNNHWQFDSNAGDNDGEITAISPFDEDGLIALDFLINTSDDDGSEIINILLTDIPNNVRLVSADGSPIVLTIAEIDPESGPVIQIDNDMLSQVYVKPEQDFSGQLTFTVIAITTEPDGDTGKFVYDLNVDVAPVVDQSDGQGIASSGIEDRNVTLNLDLSVNQDIDGSEELVSYHIDSVEDGLTLFFDNIAQEIPTQGINLSDWLDAQSPTLDILLSSGRITAKADRDLSGEFDIQLRYSVKDTSETGLTETKELQATANVLVEGRVEFDTRLESTTRVLESTDGSPIDLSNAVWFIEEDVDGSELLDYIVIEVPGGVNLIVEHPNGASQNASGDWIISAAGLTSDSAQETMAMILQDASIRSPQNTDVITIGVKARVLDDSDSAFISTQFDIQITGHDGGGGECDDVGEPGDITNGDTIRFDEGETIDLSGLLNSDIADDPDNELSFYVPADSLPDGVYLEGEGIIVEYNNDGTVAGYSVNASALSSLTLYGVDEDYAGCLEFTIVTIETSTCNGTSNETNNTISIEILPVVDDFSVYVGRSTIQEDTATDINLSLVLGDNLGLNQDIVGEGNAATGKETVQSMTITVPDGVILSDGSGDDSYIVSNGDNSYSILDATRLHDILLTPPAHFSGNLTVSVTTTIQDKADCLPGDIDVQTKTSEFTLTVAPVADQADLTVGDLRGDEDSYISLASLSAELIDQDGSENMSLSMTGVPTGAVLVIKVGGEYQLLPNNGVDGGSFGGSPTYEWQVSSDQLNDVYILPPRDFSGDIPLALEAITQEIGTSDIRYTTANFVVGVDPIGDEIEFFDVPTEVSGKENSSIEIATNLESEETNSDERIELTVIAKSDSDESALIGLNRIRVAGEEAKFTQNGDGSWSATLIVTASTLASFELFSGDAFGTLNLELQANTVDLDVVLGQFSGDAGNVTSTSLTVEIQPQPDVPELSLTYDAISAEADGEILLGINATLINPALPDETGSVVIAGLPDNLQLSQGQASGANWIVDFDDLPSLAIINGYQGEQTFTLAIEAQSELNGDTVATPFETLTVSLTEIGASNVQSSSGNDYFIGGSGNDVFEFNLDALGSAEQPSYDVIADFDFAANTDLIDLSSIFDGLNLNTGDAAEAFVGIEQADDGVEISVRSNSVDVDQRIKLADITLDDLYGADASSVTQTELLQKMIDDNNLTMI